MSPVFTILGSEQHDRRHTPTIHAIAVDHKAPKLVAVEATSQSSTLTNSDLVTATFDEHIVCHEKHPGMVKGEYRGDSSQIQGFPPNIP